MATNGRVTLPIAQPHTTKPKEEDGRGLWLLISFISALIVCLVIFVEALVMFFVFLLGEKKKRWELGPVFKSFLQVGALAVTFFWGQKLKSIASMISFLALGVEIIGITQLLCAVDDYGLMDTALGISLGVACKHEEWGFVVFFLGIPMIVLRNFAATTPPSKKTKAPTTRSSSTTTETTLTTTVPP